MSTFFGQLDIGFTNLSEMILNLKNIIHNLNIKFNKCKLELSKYEPWLINLVPSLSFVYKILYD